MAEQSQNIVKFNSNLGETLTIISPFHSELDIKTEMGPAEDRDEMELDDFEGIDTSFIKYKIFGIVKTLFLI